MSTVKKFEDKATKAYQEADRLQEQADQLIADAAAKRKEGDLWQEAAKMLVKDGIQPIKRTPKEQFRQGSDVEKAYNALVDAGKALYVDDIVKALGKEINKDTRVSIGSQIQAYARRGHVFVKTAPNTFGLLEYPAQAAEFFDNREAA